MEMIKTCAELMIDSDNLVKQSREILANLSFSDPLMIPQTTALMVKHLCVGTLAGSVAKTFLVSAVPGFVLSWLALSRRATISQWGPLSIGATQLGFTLSKKWLLEPRLDKITSIVKLYEAQDNLLSDVVIKECQADPRTRPIISKYLFGEKLLADSSTEVRWRCRYFSGSIPVDSVVYSVDFLRDDDEERQETQKNSKTTYLEEVTDPFKHVFGISGSS